MPQVESIGYLKVCQYGGGGVQADDVWAISLAEDDLSLKQRPTVTWWSGSMWVRTWACMLHQVMSCDLTCHNKQSHEDYGMDTHLSIMVHQLKWLLLNCILCNCLIWPQYCTVYYQSTLWNCYSDQNCYEHKWAWMFCKLSVCKPVMKPLIKLCLILVWFAAWMASSPSHSNTSWHSSTSWPSLIYYKISVVDMKSLLVSSL